MKQSNSKQLGTLRYAAMISQRPALCVFVFFLAFYYFTNAGGYKVGDETFISIVAKQIATQGQIGLKLTRPPHEEACVKGPDGLYYSKWGLGQSLVEVPFHFVHQLIWKLPPLSNRTTDRLSPHLISGLMLIFLVPSSVSALGCALVLLFSIRLGFSKRVAVVLSLVYGLGTMVWPYSKSLMSDTTLNVAVLGSVYAAVSYTSTRHSRWLAISGLCLGFALVTKVTSVVILPCILIYALLTIRSRRTMRDLLICFAPAFLAFLGLQFWHNAIRYGSIWEFGYNTGRDDMFGFCTPLYVGLWGLLASPGKSFFLYSPITLLGIVSAKEFFGKRRPQAFLFLGVTLTYTILHACWWAWAGDWAWGPRFLLVITPYLILPTGLFFEKWTSRPRLHRMLVNVLLIFTVAVQILGVTVHPLSFIEAREQVIAQIVDKQQQDPHSYAWSYSENAFVNFSPVFSHIVGNWWLLKHMIFSYDIWSDVPWMVMGDFKLAQPKWMNGNRTVPFWWPVAFSMLSPPTRTWIYPLAATNLLMVFWWGLRLKRLFHDQGRQD
jgi:hypothetical protein